MESISDLLVTKVVAVNRVNRLLGTYTVHNRQQCTLSYKIFGHSEFIQNGKRLISDKNHIVFVPSGASYTYHCQEQGECILLEFEALNTSTDLCSFQIYNDAEILSLMNKIEYAHTFRKTGYVSYCMSGLYKLFFYMVAQNDHAYQVSLHRKRIKAGLDYMEANLCDSMLSSRKLAEMCGISDVYFRKLFTQIYGMPPKRYINLMRMTKAQDMLLTQEMSIQQVAVELGFRDIFSFSKSFRKANDMTPTEYRKSHWRHGDS